MSDKCELCGKKSGDDKAADHLRTLYVVERGRLERGYFRPRLNESEYFALQVHGEHVVCSNRLACRARQRQAGVRLV
jgi:hypothetical protein